MKCHQQQQLPQLRGSLPQGAQWLPWCHMSPWLGERRGPGLSLTCLILCQWPPTLLLCRPLPPTTSRVPWLRGSPASPLCLHSPPRILSTDNSVHLLMLTAPSVPVPEPSLISDPPEEPPASSVCHPGISGVSRLARPKLDSGLSSPRPSTPQFTTIHSNSLAQIFNSFDPLFLVSPHLILSQEPSGQLQIRFSVWSLLSMSVCMSQVLLPSLLAWTSAGVSALIFPALPFPTAPVLLKAASGLW